MRGTERQEKQEKSEILQAKEKIQKGALKTLSKAQWHVSVVSATHEVEKGGSLKSKHLRPV